MMDVDEQKSGAPLAATSSSSSSSSASAAPLRSRRAHSPPPKKKMVIKPFKVKPALAASFEEDTAARLTRAVQAVYDKATVDMSQEELYRAVEALCIHNKAKLLYDSLVAQCEQHIAAMVKGLADQLASGDAMTDATTAAPSAAPAAASATASSSALSLPFLHSVQSVWSAHCDELLIIRGIFLYLDRTYVLQQANAAGDDSAHPKSLWDMGLAIFARQIKIHASVEEKVVAGVLALIERERCGESVNRSLLKSLLRMFAALRLYSTSFHPRFLSTTVSFYSSESARQLASSTPAEFVAYMSSRLEGEEERSRAYLDESTRAPLVYAMQETLIRAHKEQLLSPAFFGALMHARRSAELATLYRLFERIHALDDMKDAFGAYVKKTASEMVESGSVEPKETTPAAPAAASSATPAPQPASASSASAPAPAPIPAAASSPALPSSSPPPAASSTPATLVLDLLSFKASLDGLLASSFGNNPDFVYALKLAFEHAVNLADNRPAELMAKFVDRVLRTGGKGMRIAGAGGNVGLGGVAAAAAGGGEMDVDSSAASSSASASAAPASLSSASGASASGGGGGDDVDSLLESVMFLFRYLRSKDVFQAFYKRDLAKRLLLHRSASVDAEKAMLAKMKSDCGASYTSKLESMFKDMELSKDLQAEFDTANAQNARQAAPSAGDAAAQPVELSVQVLTTGSWPAYTPVDCTLPPEVSRAHDSFKLFYLNKHGGRKLIWHHSLATAVLRAHLPRGRKELAVSGLQAVVLLLFNEREVLSLEEIGRLSGISDVLELKRTLASLTFAEDSQLLRKEPRNKKLSPGDVFRVNTDFASKLFRLKLNSVQVKETRAEQAATTTRVLEDRGYAIDACIVRIMKARKTLSHQLLVMEVINQIKFPTKPADIKKRIAGLIEREYMERDKDDSNTYVYMA